MSSMNVPTLRSHSVQTTADVHTNASKRRKQTKEKKNVFRCGVCKIEISCLKNFEDHNKGRRHLNNLSKAKQKAKAIDKNTSKPESGVDASPGESNPTVDTRTSKPENGVVPSPGQSNPTENFSAAEVNMNSFNRSSGKKQRHSYQNNGYYSNHYHQSYDHDNFSQYHGNGNWDWPQRPQCQGSPWDYRNGDFPSYDERDFRFHPRKRNSSSDGHPSNLNQLYNGWVQNTKYDDVLVYDHDGSIASENCPVERGVSTEMNSSVDAEKRNTRRNSPANTSRNSEAKRAVCKKQICPVKSDDKTDKSSDNDKQIQKRSILAENVTDRIAHWINPSNPKDKAEVMKLVTEFSKSKKKENLLKLKLQTDCTSNKNNCDRKEEASSHEISSSDALKTNSVDFALVSDSVMARRNKRSSSETLQQAGNINPFISDESCGNSSALQLNKGIRKCKSVAVQPPSKKVRRKSLSNSVDEIRMSENAQVLKEVAAEKKRKEQKNSLKKHKYSTVESIISSVNAVVEKGNIENTSLTNQVTSNSASSAIAIPSIETSIVVAPNLPISNPLEQVKQVSVKQEVMDNNGSNIGLHPSILEAFSLSEDCMPDQINENPNQSDGATLTPVESLIGLFASGNIKVKKEFDDPLIDVIRTVDPEILNRVCEEQSSSTAPQEASGNHNVQNSVVDTKLALVKETPAMSDTADTDDSTNSLPFLKSSFKNILNEIQSISLSEDKVKENLEKADSKIQEYQALVDEWKTKKIKFQSEEETLRKQRNNLVRTMADLVTQYNVERSTAADTAKQDISTSSCPVNAANDTVSSASSQNRSLNVQSEGSALSNGSTMQHPKHVALCSKDNRKSKVQVIEDIAILPPPVKSNDIPLIDLEEFDLPDETGTSNVTENGWSSETSAMIERFFKEKNITVHSATINCIQFFEGFLYTCSNDCTAQRFSLNGSSVIYQHLTRNVIQLCVEKIKGLTLVFTICSGSKTVSSFKAETGDLFKTFNLNFTVASICRGKGLIYAGLRNGSIVACKWKDHRELVNISEPIKSIDTTKQGSLNILVTLSINGNVSIRDADRSGLLIRYVKARSYVPLFMTVSSESIYLSSAGVLTVLDIESGTFVTKYSFSAAYTCLAVYMDSIFTASFSGLVRCYSKDEEKAVNMYYGAGGAAITCIHVQHGWVFTGNRFGTLSVFKYDPTTVHSCKIEKCDFLFPRLEDLEFHVLQGNDHKLPAAGAACSWHKCHFIIPHNWDIKAIQAHIKSHL